MPKAIHRSFQRTGRLRGSHRRCAHPRNRRNRPAAGLDPIDVRLREGGDAGRPLVLDDPDCPAAIELRAIADRLTNRARGLVGRSLGLAPAGR